jgi:hypothetical protein
MKTVENPTNAAPLKGMAVPPEFDDAIARVAWLYYVDGSRRTRSLTLSPYRGRRRKGRPMGANMIIGGRPKEKSMAT